MLFDISGFSDASIHIFATIRMLHHAFVIYPVEYSNTAGIFSKANSVTYAT